MDLGLDGRVVVITGGTDGLGAALAELLVSEGVKVVVCGRDADRLEAARTRLTGAGGDALAVAADVTRAADIERLVEQTVARWGRIDGVVNNAGQAAAGSFEDADDAVWEYDLDLKVMAAVRLIRLALPYLRERGGAIVNVLNTGAKAARGRSLPTSASRAAGLAVTKALAHELGPDNIRVNAVLVGLVDSGQWRRRSERSGVPIAEIYESMAQGIPLGRVGESGEFADVVTYLLSDRASYVTGSAVNLDGGSSPVA